MREISSYEPFKALHGGWSCRQSIHAPEIFDNAYIMLNTQKRYHGMVTVTAHIARKDWNGVIYHYPFKDYIATIESSDCRATKGNIKRLHEIGMSKFNSIVSEAIEFYAKRGELIS